MMLLRCSTITFTILLSIGTVYAGEREKYSKKQSLANLVQNLHSKDSVVRQSAIKALCKTFEGLPIEEWHTTEHKTNFLNQAKKMVPKMIRLLRHHDQEVVQTAISMITRMGTDARAAVPALSRLANNEKQPNSIRWQAVESMFFVTPETEPVMCHLMPPHASVASKFSMYTSGIKIQTGNDITNNKSFVFAVFGMHAGKLARLLLLSGHTQIEVPYLMKAAMGEYSLEVRAIAAMVLSLLISEDRINVPKLSMLLSDQDPLIRELGAIAILRTRKTSRLTPEIIQKLHLKEDKLNEIEEFVRNLLNEEEELNNEFVDFVKNDPDSIIPELLSEIRLRRGPNRRDIIRIIRDIGPEANAAVPYLLKMLSHQDAETRRLAAAALQKIDPSAIKKALRRSRKHQQCHCTRSRFYRYRIRLKRQRLRHWSRSRHQRYQKPRC